MTMPYAYTSAPSKKFCGILSTFSTQQSSHIVHRVKKSTISVVVTFVFQHILTGALYNPPMLIIPKGVSHSLSLLQKRPQKHANKTNTHLHHTNCFWYDLSLFWALGVTSRLSNQTKACFDYINCYLLKLTCVYVTLRCFLCVCVLCGIYCVGFGLRLRARVQKHHRSFEPRGDLSRTT